MMAETTGLPFEKKAIIPIDPRTKIFLTVTVSTIMVAGGTGGIMTVISALPDGVPYVLAALIETMEKRSEILRDVCCLICVRADGVAIVNWNMEFCLGCSYWHLHTYVTRVHHGILFD